MTPVLDERPKWIGKSKAFLGVLIMLLSVIFGDTNILNIDAVHGLLSGILTDGAFTFGAILSIIGTAVRTHKITLWPSGEEG